jgi:hypothetical protein
MSGSVSWKRLEDQQFVVAIGFSVCRLIGGGEVRLLVDRLGAMRKGASCVVCIWGGAIAALMHFIFLEQGLEGVHKIRRPRGGDCAHGEGGLQTER